MLAGSAARQLQASDHLLVKLHPPVFLALPFVPRLVSLFLLSPSGRSVAAQMLFHFGERNEGLCEERETVRRGGLRRETVRPLRPVGPRPCAPLGPWPRCIPCEPRRGAPAAAAQREAVAAGATVDPTPAATRALLFSICAKTCQAEREAARTCRVLSLSLSVPPLPAPGSWHKGPSSAGAPLPPEGRDETTVCASLCFHASASDESHHSFHPAQSVAKPAVTETELQRQVQGSPGSRRGSRLGLDHGLQLLEARLDVSSRWPCHPCAVPSWHLLARNPSSAGRRHPENGWQTPASDEQSRAQLLHRLLLLLQSQALVPCRFCMSEGNARMRANPRLHLRERCRRRGREKISSTAERKPQRLDARFEQAGKRSTLLHREGAELPDACMVALCSLHGPSHPSDLASSFPHG